MSAYNETDWSWATLTKDSIGLTEGSMTKTDWVHLQYLVSTTARKSVSTALSKTSLYSTYP